MHLAVFVTVSFLMVTALETVQGRPQQNTAPHNGFPLGRSPSSLATRVEALEALLRSLEPSTEHCTNSMLGYKFTTRYAANNDIDNGELMRVTFKKKYPFTILRVRFSSNIRALGEPSAGRWYILIDGRECTSPSKVDMVLYKGSSENNVIPAVLNGLCQSTGHTPSIPAGIHHVTAHVGNLPNAGTHNRYTGWISTGILEVQELCPPY